MDVRVNSTRDVRRNHVTTIRNVRSKIDAKNKFAQTKGYKSWGDMVSSFRQSRSGNPPYQFVLISSNNKRY